MNLAAGEPVVVESIDPKAGSPRWYVVTLRGERTGIDLHVTTCIGGVRDYPIGERLWLKLSGQNATNATTEGEGFHSG